MSTDPHQQSTHRRRSFACWALSILTHIVVASGAFALVSELMLPPPQDLFRWDVSMVQAPTPAEVPAPTPPEPQPVQPPTPPPPKPVTHQPVKRAVETKEAVQPLQKTQPIEEPKLEQSEQPIQQAVPQETPSVQEVLTQTVQVSQTVARNGTVEAPRAVETPTTVETEVTTTAQPVTERGQIEEVLAPTEAPQKVEQTLTARAAPAVRQRTVQQVAVRSRPATRPDYGWLAQALWANVDERKRYPQEARRNHWTGKVTLRLTIEQRGTSIHLLDLTLEESSGHSVLDRHTQDMVRNAFPLEIKHALAQPQIQVHLPFSYSME